MNKESLRPLRRMDEFPFQVPCEWNKHPTCLIEGKDYGYVYYEKFYGRGDVDDVRIVDYFCFKTEAEAAFFVLKYL